MSATNSEIYSKHSSSQFNEELEGLRTDMLTMGGTVERQVNDSINALMNRDIDLAEATRELDRDVNRAERDINAKCTMIIARRQPAAVDLRLLMSINRAVVDLERMGDEATRVAKYVIDLYSSDSTVRGLQEVKHIGTLVAEMLKDALTAFARRDMELAYSVVKRDQQVDKEYTTAMRSLITYMMEDTRAITSVLNMIWVLRSLERIGDHACTLAEHLVYQVSGTDVAHASLEDIEDIIDEE